MSLQTEINLLRDQLSQARQETAKSCAMRTVGKTPLLHNENRAMETIDKWEEMILKLKTEMGNSSSL